MVMRVVCDTAVSRVRPLAFSSIEAWSFEFELDGERYFASEPVEVSASSHTTRCRRSAQMWVSQR